LNGPRYLEIGFIENPWWGKFYRGILVKKKLSKNSLDILLHIEAVQGMYMNYMYLFVNICSTRYLFASVCSANYLFVKICYARYLFADISYESLHLHISALRYHSVVLLLCMMFQNKLPEI